MITVESAFLRNANNTTLNNPTLRAGLLRVRLFEPLSLQLFLPLLNSKRRHRRRVPPFDYEG